MRAWRSRDPLEICRRHLETFGATAAELAEIDGQVTSEIEEAVTAAQDSPEPSPEDLVRSAYA